jgi:glycosyltransferase involved in cell wall biosynthesis
MVRYGLKHGGLVFATSIRLHEEILAQFPALNVKIIRFGPNMEKFRPQGIRQYENFTILSIRKPEPIYHQEEIVKAFENIASGLDIRLLIQRPSSKNFDLFMRKMGSPLAERIGFWDERTHEEMPGLYGAAHVGVSIPESDSFSSAVVECMACGTPVIMPSDGDTELVNPDISVGKGRTLEDAMLKAYNLWATDGHQWAEQRHRARMTAELYGNFDINMQKAEKYYHEVLG